MKSKILLVFATLLLASNAFGQNGFKQEVLIGTWLGKLHVQNFEMRLVFNISVDANGVLTSTMDSPDQGANGIKMGKLEFKSGKLKINAPAILAYYEGTLVSKDSMNGNWFQSGQSFELPLKKQREEFSIRRPQEPMPPFNYKIEEVKFKNEKANHTLAGTLTIPESEGPFPAVILISGSGAQNRNEEIFGHKPFFVIADYLTKRGIAVLRYDDQGVGASGGSQMNTTSEDFSFDAEAAFKFLKSDSRINLDAIGFAGHSEGGLIAPMVISRNPEVGFFISLAGPALIGSEILLLQSKALGIANGGTTEIIQKELDQNKALFEILSSENNNVKAKEQMKATILASLKNDDKSQEEIEKEVKAFDQGFPLVVINWMRYYVKTDPADFLYKIKCPVLVLNGDKDLQVVSKENLKAYEVIFKDTGLNDFKLVALKNHNHLFQNCNTGLPSEYSKIEQSFSPEALEIMALWIEERFVK